MEFDFEEMKKLARELEAYLYELGGHYEIFIEKDGLCVSVIWGDWKHDHIWLDRVAEKFFREKGYEVLSIDEEVTEEDGSDTYSADHYYKLSK